MAVNFKGKPAPVAAAALKAAPPQAASKSSGLSFLKRGKEAMEIAAKEEKKAEMKSKNNLFRFYVKNGESAELTFLDGDLVDGVLDIPFFHEHQVNMNGSWNNFFICTQDEEPCPICDGGSTASYVGIMTVIDHGEYTSKKDGVVHKDNVKLFVAKRDTIKMLQKYAVKRGGLRGCRFDVSRTGDKSPSVGSSFDFSEKLTDAELKAKYKEKAAPVNYDEYLKGLYTPAAELRKLGFGSSAAPVGSEAGADENYNV